LKGNEDLISEAHQLNLIQIPREQANQIQVEAFICKSYLKNNGSDEDYIELLVDECETRQLDFSTLLEFTSSVSYQQ